MTTQKQIEIKKLKDKGYGYKRIAKELNLPISTVKSHLKRHGEDEIVYYCKYCGKPLLQVKGKKHKEFCNDEHRMKWWSNHRNLINYKDVRTSICQHCGKPFQHHGKESRKYCCHECYLNERYGIK